MVVDTSQDSSGNSFAFGSTAEVEEVGTEKSHTWTLVGSTEADMAAGRLSAESPVGKALRDVAVGETVEVVTPSGTKAYRVARIVG